MAKTAASDGRRGGSPRAAKRFRARWAMVQSVRLGVRPTSSQVMGGRTRWASGRPPQPSRPAAHGVVAGRFWFVVQRNSAGGGPGPCAHQVVVTSLRGAGRSTSRAKRQPRAPAQHRRTRTTASIAPRRRAGPGPPEVLGQTDRAQLVEHLVGHVGDAAARWRGGQSGMGSRSMRPLVGLLDVGAPASFQGWNSTVDICTAQDDVGQLGDANSSSAVRP